MVWKKVFSNPAASISEKHLFVILRKFSASRECSLISWKAMLLNPWVLCLKRKCLPNKEGRVFLPHSSLVIENIAMLQFFFPSKRMLVNPCNKFLEKCVCKYRCSKNICRQTPRVTNREKMHSCIYHLERNTCRSPGVLFEMFLITCNSRKDWFYITVVFASNRLFVLSFVLCFKWMLLNPYGFHVETNLYEFIWYMI